jgi:hypothetical protein
MDNDSPKPEVPSAHSFDVRYMVPGKHSVMLLLPETYHAAIGSVVAYWGNFEVHFNICLGALIAGESADGKARETKNWRYHSFKKRRALFIAICEQWLATWKPEAAGDLRKILDLAAELQPKRNLIAHGSYGYTIPPLSSSAVGCYAINHATREKLSFDEDVLKKLYHDISHLTADLVTVFKSIGQVEGTFHTIPDDEIIRIYNTTIHPWNPDPRLRPGST